MSDMSKGRKILALVDSPNEHEAFAAFLRFKSWCAGNDISWFDLCERLTSDPTELLKQIEALTTEVHQLRSLLEPDIFVDEQKPLRNIEVVGRSIFGHDWMVGLMEKLNVNVDTIEYWIEHPESVPDNVYEVLDDLFD